MTPKNTAAALAPFFAPAILVGVQRLDIKSKPVTVLVKICNFAFLAALQFASIRLYNTGLEYFRGNSSEANHADENYTLTLFTMAHKVIAMFMTTIVMCDNIFSVGKFARHFECMDEVAQRLNCQPAYFKKVRTASIYSAVILFLGYTAMCLFQFGAWVSNRNEAINLIHVFFVIDLWMVQEWQFILVAYATRCMFTQVTAELQDLLCDETRLRNLRECHRKLCSIVDSTNKLFQPILLSTFSMQFYNLLCNFYYLAMLLWDLETHFLSTKWQAIRGICMWGCVSMSQFFFVCWNCETTIAEAKKARRLLLKIELLERRRQQLRDEIAGAVVTYVTTLLQFHLMVNQLKQQNLPLMYQMDNKMQS